MSEQEQDTPRAEIAAETMHGDLMALVVDELKAAPRPWPELGEDEQDEVIERVRRRTGEAVEDVVRIIATAGFKRIPAKLDSVQVKDGLKITLSALQNDPARHDLMDAQGTTVALVLADPERFGGGTEAVKAHAADGEAVVGNALKRLGQRPGDSAHG